MDKITDKIIARTKWIIRKFHGDREAYDAWIMGKGPGPFETKEIEGNLLLNAGITEALQLICGIAATAFSNANASIGVGDSATAAAASQDALQAAVNKAYATMEATYPQVSAQTMTFRAVFGSAAANFSWQEFTVINGADDTGDNLNRKVSDQGTKVAGQTWTVDVAITLS